MDSFNNVSMKTCTTLEALRAKVNVMSLFYTTTLDAVVKKARVEKLKVQRSPEVFTEACLAEVSQEIDILHRHTAGLNLPPGLLGNYHEPARAFALKFHKSIVTSEAKAIEKDIVKQEKEKQSKSNILEEAANFAPNVVLERCFENLLPH